MVSPFRRHQQMTRAAQSGAHVGDVACAPSALPEPKADSDAGREYAALRVLLHDNLRKLADVASIEARNPMKREMSVEFAPWVRGAIEAGKQGQAAQDEILMTMLVWAIDIHEFDDALLIAEHALNFGLTLPERYNRTVACFVAEEIATIAHDRPDAVTLEQLMRVQALTESADMPDPARAKLHKAIGRAYERRADNFDASADNAPAGGKAAYATEALIHLRRALELFKDIGVKKDIERVERTIRNLQAESSEPAAID